MNLYGPVSTDGQAGAAGSIDVTSNEPAVSTEDVVDIPIPTVLKRRLVGHKAGAISSLKFNTVRSYLLSGGQDKVCILWNPFNGKMIKAYSGVHTYEVLDVAIADDSSKFFSVGGDRDAYVTDVTTGKVLRKFIGHTRRINSCLLLNAGGAGGQGSPGTGDTF